MTMSLQNLLSFNIASNEKINYSSDNDGNEAQMHQIFLTCTLGQVWGQDALIPTLIHCIKNNTTPVTPPNQTPTQAQPNSPHSNSTV